MLHAVPARASMRTLRQRTGAASVAVASAGASAYPPASASGAPSAPASETTTGERSERSPRRCLQLGSTFRATTHSEPSQRYWASFMGSSTITPTIRALSGNFPSGRAVGKPVTRVRPKPHMCGPLLPSSKAAGCCGWVARRRTQPDSTCDFPGIPWVFVVPKAPGPSAQVRAVGSEEGGGSGNNAHVAPGRARPTSDRA